jgi:hypothetical protein
MSTVQASLACVRCRHSLRGLAALGRCPECGTAVAASLAVSVDPGLRRLAALRHPGRVAALVLLLALATLLCVALQLGGPMLDLVGGLTNQESPFPGRVRLWGWLLSAAVLATCLAAMPWAAGRHEAPLRAELGRWHRWMWIGLLAWMAAAAAAGVMQWNAPFLSDPVRRSLPWAGVALQLPGMAITLSATQVLFNITGRRSQTFSEAGAARQSVRGMNTCAALAMVLAVAAPIVRTRVGWPEVAIGMQAGAGCLAALLLMGAAYLTANAWWIARALLLPQPRLDEAVG